AEGASVDVDTEVTEVVFIDVVVLRLGVNCHVGSDAAVLVQVEVTGISLWMGYVYGIGVTVLTMYDWKNPQGLPTDKFALGVPLYGTNAAGVQITYFKPIDMGADPKGNGSFAGYSYASQPMLQEQVDLANNRSLGGLVA
ncbi:hypothetical protein FOZ62_003006, partial [Perkinsus olseni]